MNANFWLICEVMAWSNKINCMLQTVAVTVQKLFPCCFEHFIEKVCQYSATAFVIYSNSYSTI
jgi:hypothetical protein